MKKNIKLIIMLVIVGAAIIISVVMNFRGHKVPANPPSTIGNTAGNLNNGGLFCESNGTVYFSNPYDNGCIYSMKPDESKIQKVNTSNSKYICAAGDFLYYYMDTSNGGTGLGYVIKTFGLYRSKTNGKNNVCLDKAGVTAMQLIGNQIVYQRYNNKEYTKLYSINTDKSDKKLLSDEIINPASAENGQIYFGGQGKDHYLYMLNPQTGQVSTLYSGNVWNPILKDGYVYYMDTDNNLRLCRLNLSGGNVEVLTNDSVDSFNVGDMYVYYQKVNDGYALKRVTLDGSSSEVVSEGIYNSINLTSQYAYFKMYGDDTTIYHTSVSGPVNVEPFALAMMAVLKE